MRRAVILLLLAAAAPASAAGLTLDYRLYIGGLHALSLTTALSRDRAGYRVAVSARTDGLVARFVEASYVAEASGTTAGGVAIPESFRGTASDDEDGERSVALTWSLGVPAVVFEPADDAPDEPLAGDLIAATVDPTSAMLTLMETLAASGHCDVRVRVFDGKRRYDLVSRDAGERVLKASRYAPYGGPATECVIAIERLAGFRKARLAERYPAEMSIYFARLRDDLPPLPVRLHAENLFGALRMHLVGWRDEAG